MWLNREKQRKKHHKILILMFFYISNVVVMDPEVYWYRKTQSALLQCIKT